MLVAEKRKFAKQAVGKINFDFREPIRLVDHTNFYKFEMSNPIVGLDPMGLADSPGQSTTPPVSNGNSNSTNGGGSVGQDSRNSQGIQDVEAGAGAFFTDQELMDGMLDAGGFDFWCGGPTTYDKAFDFQREMQKKYGNNFDKDALNEAARHLYWSAELTRLYGADRANKITDLHETGEVDRGNAADSDRDQAHNQLGRQLGQKATCEEDVKALAEDAIRNGQAFDQNLNDPSHPTHLQPHGVLPPPTHVLPPPPIAPSLPPPQKPPVGFWGGLWEIIKNSGVPD